MSERERPGPRRVAEPSARADRMSDQRVLELRERVRQGAYDTEDVRREVARRMMARGDA